MMASLGMEAKSMKDLLVSMPDEVMPCLNKNMRLEFAELQEMGVKTEVKNLLEEVSVMDTLTQDFVRSRMMLDKAVQLLDGIEPDKHVVLGVNRSDVSKMIGQHRCNVTELTAKFKLRSLKITQTDINSGEIKLLSLD